MPYDTHRPERRGSRDPEAGRHDMRFDSIPTGPRRDRLPGVRRSQSHEMLLDGTRDSLDVSNTNSSRLPATEGLSTADKSTPDHPSDPRRINKTAMKNMGTATMLPNLQGDGASGTTTPDHGRQPGFDASNTKSDTTMNTFKRWLSQLVKHAILEDRLDRKRQDLTDAMKEEEAFLQKYPDQRAINDRVASYQRRKLEYCVANLQSDIETSQTRSDALLMSMNEQQQAFLMGIFPNILPSVTTDNVTTSRVETLERSHQGEERDLEEHDEKLKALERALEGQKHDLERCTRDLKKQSNELVLLQESITTHKDTLNQHNSQIKDLSSSPSQHTEHASLLSKALDELKEIRDEVQGHKVKLAGLSSILATCSDQSELEEQLSSLKASLEGNNKLIQQRIEQIEISNKLVTDNLTNLMELCARQSEFQVTKEADFASLRDQIAALGETVADMKQISSTEQVVTSGSRNSTNELDNFKLQLHQLVRKVETFENPGLSQFQNKFSAVEESLYSLKQHLGLLGGVRSASEQASDSLVDRVSHLEQCYNRIKSELDSSVRQEIRANHAEVAKLQTNIKTLRPHILANSNAIKNLNTRYNSLSTQQLYQSIVTSIVPLGPLYDELLSKVTSIESQTKQLREEMNAKGSDPVSPALETRLRELESRVESITDRNDPTLYQGTVARFADLTQQVQDIKAQIQALADSHDSDRVNPEKFKNLSAAIEKHHGRLMELHDRLIVSEDRLALLDKDIPNIKDKADHITKLATDIHVTNDRVAALEAFDWNDQSLEDLRQKAVEIERLANSVDTLTGCVKSLEELSGNASSSSTVAGTSISDEISRLNDKLAFVRFAQEAKDQEVYLPEKGSKSAYIKISCLASVIDVAQVRVELAPTRLLGVCFRGGKIGETKKTTRFALAWIEIDHAANEDAELDALKARLDGRRWKGRAVKVERVDRETVVDILFHNPPTTQDDTQAPIAPLPAAPVPATALNIENLCDSLEEDTIVLNEEAKDDRPGGPAQAARARTIPQASDAGERTSVARHSMPPAQDYLTVWDPHTTPRKSSDSRSHTSALPTRSSTSTPVGNQASTSKRTADQLSGRDSLEARGAATKKSRRGK